MSDNLTFQLFVAKQRIAALEAENRKLRDSAEMQRAVLSMARAAELETENRALEGENSQLRDKLEKNGRWPVIVRELTLPPIATPFPRRAMR